MNYYFEFADNIVGRQTYLGVGSIRAIPHKYCVRYGIQGLSPLMPSKLSYLAQRIWAEDHNGNISFVKNRNDTMNTPVDSKEFMWVKLSAVKV